MKRVCENCEAFHDSRRPGLGECRRRAPAPSTEDNQGAWWPVVTTRDWCMEFNPKDQQETGR